MKTSNNNLVKNYTYNLIYQVLNIFTPFITAPYTSRVLGSEGIGKYSFTAATVSYFALVAALGINMYGQREIAYTNGDSLKQLQRFWEIFIFKLFTVLLALSIFITYVLHQQENQTILFIQSLTIINVFFDITWFYQGLGDFKSIAFRNMLVKFIGVAAIFVFVRDAGDLAAYVLIQTGSVFIGNLVLWFPLKKIFAQVSIRKSVIHPFRNIKVIIELFIPMLAIQVYTVLDKTMLGVITGSDLENGYYEQTTKIINLCMAIVTSLGTVLTPYMSGAFARGEKETIARMAEKAYGFVLMVASPVCVGLIAIANYFVPWFFGAGYDKVIPLLRIYGLTLVIIPLSNIASFAILTPTKQQNKGTLAVVGGAIVNMIMNMYLITRLQSLGAAIATVVAETVVTSLYFIFIRDYVNIASIIRQFLRYFLTACVMGIVVIFSGAELERLGLSGLMINIIQVAIGGGVYIGILYGIMHDSMLVQGMQMVKEKLKFGKSK